MARRDEHDQRGRTRHPEQQESRLASTREDASLAEQVADDSPHPDARRDTERYRRRESEELGHS